MKKTIYVLGNQYLETDKMAVKVANVLRRKFPRIHFVHIDPTEEFDPEDKNITIIDTVIGIDKVVKSNGLNHWTVSPRNTVHDFDLPVSLELLQKLGRIKKITVIGIPSSGNLQKIADEATTILKGLAFKASPLRNKRV